MIVTIGGTYAPFCMRMASLFFKFKAQGQTLNIVVVVRKIHYDQFSYDCQFRYTLLSLIKEEVNFLSR